MAVTSTTLTYTGADRISQTDGSGSTTYKNVGLGFSLDKSTATAQQIFDVGMALGGCLNGTLLEVRTTETCTLVNNA